MYGAGGFIQINIQYAIFILGCSKFRIGVWRQIDVPGYVLITEIVMMITCIVDGVGAFFVTDDQQ